MPAQLSHSFRSVSKTTDSEGIYQFTGIAPGRTAREVVSRLLKELERQGALQLERGRIELRNLDSLRRLAAER